MKILAFTDIHSETESLGYISPVDTIERLNIFKKQIQKEGVDMAICTGDFTVFNEEVEILIQKIADLNIPVMLVHGNHEDEDEVAIICKQYDNIHYIHKKAEKMNGYTFIGYGGDGFSQRDPEFVQTMKKLMKDIKPDEKVILLTHAPPYKTKLDHKPDYGYVGSKDYKEFIENTKQLAYSFCGHIHEGFETEEKIGNCTAVNPGPDGRIITL